MSLLLLLLLAPAQASDSQALVYDLSVGGRAVGSREVTINYLDVDGAAVRVIESYTAFDVQVAGVPFSYVNRASVRVDARGAAFTSSVSENGELREVQARSRRDGSWTVTVLEDGTRAATRLSPGDVDLCSLELLDPIRHEELTARPRAELLAAETGTLLAGQVEDLGESSLDIGGSAVPVHRWAWTPPTGRVELAWSLDGLLVSYETAWMGKKLGARLRALPSPRSFGEIGPIGGVVEGVAEEEL